MYLVTFSAVELYCGVSVIQPSLIYIWARQKLLLSCDDFNPHTFKVGCSCLMIAVRVWNLVSIKVSVFVLQPLLNQTNLLQSLLLFVVKYVEFILCCWCESLCPVSGWIINHDRWLPHWPTKRFTNVLDQQHTHTQRVEATHPHFTVAPLSSHWARVIPCFLHPCSSQQLTICPPKLILPWPLRNFSSVPN